MSSAVLIRRHELLARLLVLSRRQQRALEHGRMDEFLALLDEREELLRALARQPRDADLPANVTAMPIPGDDMDARVAVGLLVADILLQDEENERLLREEMGRIREALLRINHVHAAAQGYAAALPERRLGTALDLIQ